MLYNIGYTNTLVIYHHSTVITKVMMLYHTEWQYDHGMVVNYCGKKFYNIGPWWVKMLNVTFGKIAVAQSEFCQTLFCDFLN
jgi:hypothetical protein